MAIRKLHQQQCPTRFWILFLDAILPQLIISLPLPVLQLPQRFQGCAQRYLVSDFAHLISVLAAAVQQLVVPLLHLVQPPEYLNTKKCRRSTVCTSDIDYMLLLQEVQLYILNMTYSQSACYRT